MSNSKSNTKVKRGLVGATTALAIMIGLSSVAPASAVFADTTNSTDTSISSSSQDEIPVTDIKVDCASIRVSNGGSVKINASVLPSNATNKNLVFYSTHPGVRISQDGVVSSMFNGDYIIGVKTPDGTINKTIKFHVDLDLIGYTKFNENNELTSAGFRIVYINNIGISLVDTKYVEGKTDGYSEVFEAPEVAGYEPVNKTITMSIKNGKINGIPEFAYKKIGIIPVSAISISNKDITLDINGTSKIEAIVQPSDATDKSLVYSASNDNITVDTSGTIKANRAGDSVVTVKSLDGKISNTINVHVNAPTPTTKTFDISIPCVDEAGNVVSTPFIKSIKEGETVEVTAQSKIIAPDSVWYEIVGSNTINVTADSNGIVGNPKFIYKKFIGVNTLNVDEHNPVLKVGDKHQIKASVNQDAGNKTILYTSSDSSIAAVSDTGLVTALKEGTAKITVKPQGGDGFYQTVNVIVSNSSLVKVTISKDEISLKEGAKETIQATVNNEEGLLYSSSNDSIAKVSETGEVTAIKEGTAYVNVTAKSDSSVNKSVKVVVAKADVTPTEPTTPTVVDVTPSTIGDNEVAGYVRDANGKGIPNVEVTLHSTVKTTTTDANGFYRFTDVDEENHTIEIPQSVVDTNPGMKLVVVTEKGVQTLVNDNDSKFSLVPNTPLDIEDTDDQTPYNTDNSSNNSDNGSTDTDNQTPSNTDNSNNNNNNNNNNDSTDTSNQTPVDNSNTNTSTNTNNSSTTSNNSTTNKVTSDNSGDTKETATSTKPSEETTAKSYPKTSVIANPVVVAEGALGSVLGLLGAAYGVIKRKK